MATNISNSNTKIGRARKYITLHPKFSDMYYCNVCTEIGVEKLLSGKKTSNLTKHFKDVHQILYSTQIDPETKYHFAKKRLKKMQSFCEIIAVDGRPFNWLNGTGFLRSQEDDLNELGAAGFPIFLDKNFTELKSYIKKIAGNIRDEIKADLKDQFVSLMLDIATKNHQSVLGINVQYMKDDCIETPSLGTLIMNKSHTAKYISDMLLECLNEFDMPIDLIISMTTDNASNMIAMIKRFDEYVHKTFDLLHIEDEEIEPVIPTFDSDGPLDDTDIEEILNAFADAEALNDILDDGENFDELFEEIIGDVTQRARLVETVRCASHSTQLMVRDGLKKSGFKPLLALCKYVAKKLRTESYKISAEAAGIEFKLPHISCATRWDSDYYMVITN